MVVIHKVCSLIDPYDCTHDREPVRPIHPEPLANVELHVLWNLPLVEVADAIKRGSCEVIPVEAAHFSGGQVSYGK